MKIKREMPKFFPFILALLLMTGCNNDVRNFSQANTKASIFPDYNDVVIPPNIAPLNFIIKEEGSSYKVNIYSKNGNKIQISQSSPKIDIPISKWHKLLDKNKGNNLFIDIYVKNKKWTKYATIKDSIVTEKIDPYMAYRTVNAVYIFSRKMGIYQRNLENFDESTIINNSALNYGCVNCHSFPKNDPSKMVMHVRKNFPGTVIYDSGTLKKVSTKTPYTMSGGVYPAWHPGGNFIAFAVLRLDPIITTRKNKNCDLADIASDLVIYDVKKDMITTSPKVSTKSRENMPAWSPDGKWLYFINAPQISNTLESILHEKYDLLRIPYDVNTNTWGNVDTVLTARELGLSITFPAISPDGKFLLFTTSDYGYFTIYHQISDQYMLDLTTHKYKKLNVSSDQADSYHSWGSNSHWFVFSSKRMDNLYTRPYFAYVDDKGNSYKPFVLPQKDPSFYDVFLSNYNRPELITGKVKITQEQMRDFIYKDPKPVTFDPTVEVDALSGATKITVPH